jgi:hypothetical protein
MITKRVGRWLVVAVAVTTIRTDTCSPCPTGTVTRDRYLLTLPPDCPLAVSSGPAGLIYATTCASDIAPAFSTQRLCVAKTPEQP